MSLADLSPTSHPPRHDSPLDSAVSKYADWRAPKNDGETLFWPSPTLAMKHARDAALIFNAATAQIKDMPIADFRRLAREFFGHRSAAPLIMTAHQCELHHPGVWSKNIAIDQLAKQLGGGATAVHLAVDTDAAKHLKLRLGSDSLPITDDPQLSTAKWTGLLIAPTPAHLARLEDAAQKWADQQTFVPVVLDTLADMRSFALDGHENAELPSLLASSMHKLDWSLGLEYQLTLLSPVLRSTAWLGFVHHLLADAACFSLAYNKALIDHRAANHIDSSTRPMPDLAIVGNSIEMPFWLDSLHTGRRERLTVHETSGGAMLTSPTSGESIELLRETTLDDAARQLAEFCRINNVRIAPRALTLTCFMRLCVCDLFVHGIGGGRYDQVLDRIFVSYFQLPPPPFAVVTATLFHPDAPGRSRACVPCVLMEGHRLWHDVLGDEKNVIRQQIEAAPRKSVARFSLFQDMHSRLETAAANDPRLVAWEARLRRTKHKEELDAQYFDRELFYALQPRERLEEMVRRLSIAASTTPFTSPVPTLIP